MRTREFMMKDLYSFSTNREQHLDFYERCAQTYIKIFDRLGIGDSTFRTFASGGSFSKFSDEFQTLCDAGEDIIYLDREKKIAVNE
jgi:prolyl-tRNA synthetase